MKIRGIKRGQTIELLDQIDTIPDGAEVIVELIIYPSKNSEVKQSFTDEEKLARLNQLFGDWKDQPDLMEIFAEIDKQRHAYRGRAIDSLDDQNNS